MAQERVVRLKAADSASTRVALAGDFELVVDGRTVSVPHAVERVLAYLALAARTVSRQRLASALWPDLCYVRASKNLRTALWRVQRAGPGILSADMSRVRLAPGVSVDVVDLLARAKKLISNPCAETLTVATVLIEKPALLPDWDDEWLSPDRENYRTVRLEALETAARDLLDQRRLAEALLAGLAVVRSDPLRESARRLVIETQIAQGNVADAVRGFLDYRRGLRSELGLEPSRALTAMIGPWLSEARFGNGLGR